jgi:predicted metal-dependent phosphoesterase TrpH
MPVDLHVHTTASDGALSPSDVVRAALKAGLSAIAITDHDSTAGLDEAIAAAEGSGLVVVQGVELSADARDAGDVHVLGLMIDRRDARLRDTLASLRNQRVERARAMTEMLARAGHRIGFEEVLAFAGAGSVGRVHVAQALVDAGSVATVAEAFTLLIGEDAPFYVPKRTLSPARAVALIHAAGGVAVLAHPGLSGASAIPELIEGGLDGIEAFHAEHTPEQQAAFAQAAADAGLLVTGGSDYHGPGVHSAPIGGSACPDGALEALQTRATRYRR